MTGLIDVVASGVADGPDAVRRAARARLREGADFVKVCASNSPIADGHLPPQDEYTAEEPRAAAEEAHAKGALVAAHESDTACEMSRGGVDDRARTFSPLTLPRA
jgi:imidazolonepropionase-like amidohydrolase